MALRCKCPKNMWGNNILGRCKNQWDLSATSVLFILLREVSFRDGWRAMDRLFI